MNLTVTGCADCPWIDRDAPRVGWACNHPGAPKHAEHLLAMPDWCPLLVEPATVSVSSVDDDQRSTPREPRRPMRVTFVRGGGRNDIAEVDRILLRPSGPPCSTLRALYADAEVSEGAASGLVRLRGTVYWSVDLDAWAWLDRAPGWSQWPTRPRETIWSRMFPSLFQSRQSPVLGLDNMTSRCDLDVPLRVIASVADLEDR